MVTFNRKIETRLSTARGTDSCPKMGRNAGLSLGPSYP